MYVLVLEYCPGPAIQPSADKYALHKALASLHSKSILHGDIRLDNFVNDSSGHVRIIDFGFSKIAEFNEMDEFDRKMSELDELLL